MEGLKVRRVISRLASMVVLLVGLQLASAKAREYTVESWVAGHGLEARGMTCCIVGRDGTVWIGAIGDLIRFDGVRFDRVPFHLGRSFAGDRITALWEDHRCRIWCGYETGEVVEFDPASGESILWPVKWERTAVRAIGGDPTGAVWVILDDHNVVRVSDGRNTGPDNLGGCLRFFSTKDGQFVAERSGILFRWKKDGTWTPYYPPLGYINAACPSIKGGIWSVSLWMGKIVRRADDGTILEARAVPDRLPIIKVIEAKTGDLICATDGGGIVNVGKDSTVETYGAAEGVSSPWILSIAEDHVGNIVGVSSDGVSVLRRAEARVLEGADALGGVRLTGVSPASDGGVWVGTEGKGLYHLSKGGIEHFARESGLTITNVWGVLDAGPEGVLAGTWGGGVEVRKDGLFQKDQEWNYKQHAVATVLLHGADGSIWAGTNDGIGRKMNGLWTWYTQCGSTRLTDIRYLALGQSGRIWFGSYGLGVGYIDGSDVILLGSNAQPASRYLSALKDDGRGGVWIGTEGAGLFNWRNGHWVRVTVDEGLPSGNIYHIDDDGHGRLWFTSSVGVFAVGKDELESILAGERHAVRPVLINGEDGLPSNQCAGGTTNAAFLDASGNYYVPTSAGLAVIDTNRIRDGGAALHPYITRVAVDARQIALAPGGTIVAPSSTQSIRVEYTAPTLTHPALVEFAYRLDSERMGDWVRLGQNRVLSLQRLSPGLHYLEIRAWNPGSDTMGPSGRLTIDRRPTLFETLWFRGALAGTLFGLLVLGIWGVLRQRYRRRQRRLELEAAVEKERRRIARDIHDDLGAHLAQVMLLSQNDREEGAAPERRQLFEKIHFKAKEITKSLDELVWAVNPKHDTVEGFASYAARLAQEIISAAGLRCRLRFPEQVDARTLGSGARHHLMMCMKEAIANAIQHASCTQIEVMLEIEQGLLRLTISDDGRGFEAATGLEANSDDVSHSGCGNLRDRMHELQGSVKIVSQVGKGTRIILECPL